METIKHLRMYLLTGFRASSCGTHALLVHVNVPHSRLLIGCPEEPDFLHFCTTYPSANIIYLFVCF